MADKKGMRVRSEKDVGLWDTVKYDELFGSGFRGNTYSDIFKLAVSMVCIDVKSQDVSKTPLYLRKRVTGGSVIVQPSEHPVAKMLAMRPNRYYGIGETIKIAVMHLCTAQQYYVAVRRNRKTGDVVEFHGIPHTSIDRFADVKSRRYVYKVNANTTHEQIQYGWATKDGGLLDDQIAHIRMRSMNGFDILDTGAVGSAAFKLVSAMADYQKGIYSNGGVPALAFTFPEGMTDVQYERLKKDLDASAKSLINKGKPLVLEGSDGNVPKVEKLSVSATDNDFMKANNQAMLDVLRNYRVPPHKAFVFESVKYDNLDAMERLYVDDSLVPIFDAIEEALMPVLLSDDEQSEYFLEFDREAAYATNPTERQKIVESLWTKGMISKNEMRERIGENRIDGPAGDVFNMSGNFVLTDPQNKPVLMSGGNAPDAEGAEDKEDPEEDKKPAKKLALVRYEA